ncbi:MAG: DNA-processing protein DprA [Dissulfurimicrobium sp.]|uniref:DNA-processing protein DprA n=1 Tax=Dissulfurimicrobium sp. TaxID=2022436 RepID=UPI00404A0A17
MTDKKANAASAWIALQMVLGVRSVAIRRLVDQFGSPEAVLNASASELNTVEWLSPRIKNAILAGPDQHSLKRCMDALTRINAWVLTYKDMQYPELLRQIPDPPAVLYGLGDPSRLAGRSIAVVGSRKASPYGIRTARDISSGLVKKGLTVVSGMAPGIDTAAHEAALKADGVTIAVKGCGIDIPYPRHDNSFIERMISNGAIITEFPPGVTPKPRNFPIRNRIISGLCLGVVIIEAGIKSGSLITAACALEQGREVMAIPGSIYSNKSMGSHWLIKQGARLVENATDILEGLDGPCVFKDASADSDMTERDKRPDIPLGPEERLLLDMLDAYPVHIDELTNLTGLPVAQVSAILIQMELKDIVQALPGQMYQRKQGV